MATVSAQSQYNSLSLSYKALGYEADGFVIEELYREYPLDDIVDDQKNTILHHLVTCNNYFDIERLCHILSEGRFSTIDPRNIMGQSPLEIAAQKGLQLHVHLLLHHRADPSHLQKLQASKNHLQIELVSKDIQTVIATKKALQLRPELGSFNHLIVKCEQNHIDLNGPFDEKDHTFLHLLTSSDPDPAVLDIFLRNNKKIDLNKRNSDGQTALMLAAKMAQQLLIFILLQHGADPDLRDLSGYTAEDYGKASGKALSMHLADLSKYPSLYFHLIRLIDVNLEKCGNKNKIDVIFDSFVDYMVSSNWVYDTRDVTHNHNLLKQPSSGKYSLNCIGVSYALYYLFFAYGITDVKLDYFASPHSNQGIKMYLPKPDCEGLIGNFRCFDPTVDQELQATGSLSFSTHCVVKKMKEERYFDPTFCCSYDDRAVSLDFIDLESSPEGSCRVN